MTLCYNCFHEVDPGEFCPYCGYSENSDREKYPLALPHGSVLGGRYITGRVLGQGGFGITYVAQDYTDKKLVAIKEYFPDTLATRQNGTTVSTFNGEREDNYRYGKECFLSEAKTLAEFIGNPNIVRVYSYFEENGTAYFAMEYIEGISLLEYVKSCGGRIPYEEALRYILPIMDALSAIHAKGIIHRDISPDNIFITKDGAVKLIDFGAARYSMGDRSRSLDVVLKHGYAPKEQYARRGRQGPYTDIYALAATLYRLITGHVPPDSIERMEEDDLASPSTMGAVLPYEAEEAILKALSVSASDRYQRMDEFKSALLGGAEAPVQPVMQPVEPISAASDSMNAVSSVQPRSISFEPVTMPDTPVQTDSAPVQVPETPVQSSVKKKSKIWILAPSIGAVAVAAVLFFVLLFPKLTASDLDKAKDAMESGDYNGARDILEKMEPSDETSSLISESYYLQAKDEMSAGNYAEALTTLEHIPDYKDSADLVNEAHYQLGISYLASRDYRAAKVEFRACRAYRDAADMLLEADYQYANQLLTDGDYSTASTVFASLKSYKDGNTLFLKSHYLLGKSYMDEGLYYLAVNEFEECVGYENTNDLLKEAKYQFVINGDDDIRNLVSYNYLKELKDANYKDSATIYKNRYTWKVKPVFANNSENDETTLKSSTPSNCSYFHAGFEIIGGVPDETITMYAVTSFPNEGDYRSSWEWEDFTLGYTCIIFWANGFDAYSGTLTITVYNSANDQKLGSLSIRLE